MAFMKREPGRVELLSEEEIDNFVIVEAEDDEAWHGPIKVTPSARTSFSLPGDLAARAAFLARLHHMKRVDQWLAQVIRERIELEEVAFAEAKRELSAGSGAQPSAAPGRSSRR
jgi:hypothetical protein